MTIVKKNKVQSDHPKASRFGHFSGSSLLSILGCGVIVFLFGVAYLASCVHRANVSSYKRFAVNVAAQSVLSYFDFKKSDISHNEKKLDKRNDSVQLSPRKTRSKRSLNSTWAVVGGTGVVVRESASFSSRVLRNLPTGSIVIADSSTIFNVLNSHTGSESSRLFISYPLHGWVSIKTFTYDGRGSIAQFRRHLKPLQYVRKIAPVVSEEACSERSFLVNRDFNGGDITTINQPISLASAGECCTYCLQNKDCSAWTFTEDNTCWLKDSDLSKSVEKFNLISGFIGKDKRKISSQKMQLEVSPFAGSDRISASCCSMDTVKASSRFSNSSSKYSSSSLKLDNIPMSKQDLSPYSVSVERTNTDWTSQWPIGTGKFGALVGGTLHQEVIPLSIGGLFGINNAEDITIEEEQISPEVFSDVEAEEEEEDNKEEPVAKKGFFADIFQFSNSALHSKLSKVKKKARGHAPILINARSKAFKICRYYNL
jgi:PAN domain